MWNWVANLFSINVSQTAPRHDAGAKPSQSQVAFLKFPTASTDSAMDPAIGRGPDCRTARDSSRSALPMPRTDFRADQHSLVKFLVDQLPPPPLLHNIPTGTGPTRAETDALSGDQITLPS